MGIYAHLGSYSKGARERRVGGNGHPFREKDAGRRDAMVEETDGEGE